MFNQKPALILLILCSFSLLLTLQFNPTLQKGYFYIVPNNLFSHELLQTRNGTIAHYYMPFGDYISGSRFMLFDHISGDGSPILAKTAIACQIVSEEGTPTSKPIHYHTPTDNLIYFCPSNGSLLFINQADHTVSSALPLNLNATLHHAKLTTDGWSVSILAMDSLFNERPQNSILTRVDMQSKQIVSQVVFNQNMTAGEAVVAYASGPKTNYIATNVWQNKRLTTKIYSIIMIGNNYQITPVVNFTSSVKTITKLFAIGNFIIVNVDSTLYFINTLTLMKQFVSIRIKELTEGIFHPAVVRSTDGTSLYVHSDTSSIMKYTIVSITIFTKNFGVSLDMQVASATQTSNELMFTYDASGVFFKIFDLQTEQYIRTAISGIPSDLMLTNTTYIVVKTVNNTNINTIFYILDLKTDSLVITVNISSSKYYHNKDQHTVTFLSAPLNSSCQVTHLDLTSGKIWTTQNLTSSDACYSYVSFARITQNGNPELVIPTNQSYLIISEAYGQITFNTSESSHDNDLINVNFDDMTLYCYHADQAAIQISASLYTFDAHSQSFQLNKTNVDNKYVGKNSLFTVNENLTLAINPMNITLINQLNTQWFQPHANYFNSATGFEDQNGILFLFFSYVGNDQPLFIRPLILNSTGGAVSAPIREDTQGGQVTGPRSFALYDMYAFSSDFGIVRFYNSDPQDSKTLISI